MISKHTSLKFNSAREYLKWAILKGKLNMQIRGDEGDRVLVVFFFNDTFLTFYL